MKKHQDYIQLCFELALKAKGMTSPNPYVGAVIVKNDKIIGKGFHKKSGSPHAEVEAYNNVKEDIAGSTLYCNLEPCCHENKQTPPCAQAIIKWGIKKVVISNFDPNPDVAGKGIALLEDAGIEVITGILEDEGKLLNEVFFTHIEKKRPFIHLKWAQTLDGKVATCKHDSKWITNKDSRLNSHKERELYDAVCVGANTANLDDPSLSIRYSEEYCKKRVILAANSTLNSELKVFNDQYKADTIIVRAPGMGSIAGIKTIECPLINKQFDLAQLMKILYQENIFSLYVEGGMQTIASFINHGFYDRISIYMAPKILGSGIDLQILPRDKMEQTINFTEGHFKHFADNILFESQRNLCLPDL